MIAGLHSGAKERKDPGGHSSFFRAAELSHVPVFSLSCSCRRFPFPATKANETLPVSITTRLPLAISSAGHLADLICSTVVVRISPSLFQLVTMAANQGPSPGATGMDGIMEALRHIQQTQSQLLTAVESIAPHSSAAQELRSSAVVAGTATPTAPGTPPLVPADAAHEPSLASSPGKTSGFTSRIILT